MRKRIDRYVEDSLIEFSDWYLSCNWYGKERDCVNLFAHNFLASGIDPGAAIKHLGQIRIESPVPQPTPMRFKRYAAAKDLVIWKDSLTTAWDENYQAVNSPLLVMEWKTKRIGNKSERYDDHDTDWLEQFTKENSKSYGYLVRTYYGPRGRAVDWAKVKNGKVGATNRRS